MQFLCIGIEGNTDEVKRHISNGLEQLKGKRIKYSIEEAASEGLTSIICSINDKKVYEKKSRQPYKTLKAVVSNVLADYIIRRYEQKLIERIINSNYCYFSPMERKEILKYALNILMNEEKAFLNSYFQIRRRNMIIHRLLDYFENSNNIILDGFVNFRLKDYVRDLEDIVDKAVDDFLMEREYREFIRLLRYFVDLQDQGFSEIHVIASFDGRYILLDETKREITNECIKEFSSEISGDDINHDDLLVSSLITLAPRKITIHGVGQFKNKELLETIKNVFCGKVFLCGGCEICAEKAAKNEDGE